MARFSEELPNDLIKQFEAQQVNCKKMFEEMTRAGAEVAYKNVTKNMKSSFKDSSKLEPYLKITKTYHLKDGSISTKVAFYGYYKEGKKIYTKKVSKTLGHEYKTGKGYRQKRVSTGRKGAEYTYNGVPVPLIVIAREFGTSSGEAKKPFFRKSFKKTEIETEMKKVQDKYLTKE